MTMQSGHSLSPSVRFRHKDPSQQLLQAAQTVGYKSTLLTELLSNYLKFHQKSVQVESFSTPVHATQRFSTNSLRPASVVQTSSQDSYLVRSSRQNDIQERQETSLPSVSSTKPCPRSQNESNVASLGTTSNKEKPKRPSLSQSKKNSGSTNVPLTKFFKPKSKPSESLERNQKRPDSSRNENLIVISDEEADIGPSESVTFTNETIIEDSSSDDEILPTPVFRAPARPSQFSRTSLDTTRPSLDTTRPSLDTTRPSLDTTRPSLDTTRPSLDTTRPSLDTNRPSLDTTRPSLDTTRPSLDTNRPSLDTHQAITGYHQAITGYQQAITGYHQAITGYHQTFPGYHQTITGYHQTFPGYHQTFTE
ncbi:chitin biosynthesis protein CHS5-like [Homalodisca vitripennis]|uniref:chitin biosynthesis protein CHS5-like n=1 Tax=Homalodisca vitripennis TaxID=197043 RepID=UPI001EECEB63|nr:chitin biosynthesis protein CHS5-like [Homalodisca vitripennis]